MPTHGECSDKQEHLRPIKKHPNHSKYLQITNCGVALPSLSPSSSLAFRQVGLLPTFSVLFSLRVRIHVYPTLVRSQSHMFLYSMSHCAYVQIYIYIIIYTYYVCVCIYFPAPKNPIATQNRLLRTCEHINGSFAGILRCLHLLQVHDLGK